MALNLTAAVFAHSHRGVARPKQPTSVDMSDFSPTDDDDDDDNDSDGDVGVVVVNDQSLIHVAN